MKRSVRLVRAAKSSKGAIARAQRDPVVITHVEVLHIDHCEPDSNPVTCRDGDVPFAV